MIGIHNINTWNRRAQCVLLGFALRDIIQRTGQEIQVSVLTRTAYTCPGWASLTVDAGEGKGPIAIKDIRGIELGTDVFSAEAYLVLAVDPVNIIRKSEGVVVEEGFGASRSPIVCRRHACTYRVGLIYVDAPGACID